MQLDIEEKYMRAAISEASQAKAAGDLPFGAVVVREDKIVGRGRVTNNTTGDVTDHAELRAVRSACKQLNTNNLEACSIYCTNEPCNMCAAAIFQAHISIVVIGASRDDLPHLLRPRKIRIDDIAEDSGHEIKIVRGVLKNQVLQQFSDIK